MLGPGLFFYRIADGPWVEFGEPYDRMLNYLRDLVDHLHVPVEVAFGEDKRLVDLLMPSKTGGRNDA